MIDILIPICKIVSIVMNSISSVILNCNMFYIAIYFTILYIHVYPYPYICSISSKNTSTWFEIFLSFSFFSVRVGLTFHLHAAYHKLEISVFSLDNVVFSSYSKPNSFIFFLKTCFFNSDLMIFFSACVLLDPAPLYISGLDWSLLVLLLFDVAFFPFLTRM